MRYEAKQNTHLSQSQLAAAPEERIRILQQRLQFLDNRIHQLHTQLLLLLCTRSHNRKELALDLGNKRINEEVDLCALEGAAFFIACLLEVRRVGVGEELGYDGGFGDDGSVVADGWDKAAGIDGQIFLSAGDGEIDDLFLKGRPSSARAMWAR